MAARALLNIIFGFLLVATASCAPRLAPHMGGAYPSDDTIARIAGDAVGGDQPMLAPDLQPQPLLTPLPSETPATEPTDEPVVTNPSPTPSPSPSEITLVVPPQPEPGEVEPDSLPAAGFYDNSKSTAVFDMIRGAKQTLDIEIYQMYDADVRLELRNALARGVRIRVVQEPEPLNDECLLFTDVQASDAKRCADLKRLRGEVISRGGAYVPFNKAALCANASKYCFQHGKLMIADAKALLVSTGNFNTSNLCNLKRNPTRCNRDYSMVIRDTETVRFLSAIFEQDLAAKPYDLESMVVNDPQTKVVTVSPFSREPLVNLIKAAKKSIRVENQYLQERTLNVALMDAARRGVNVEITLASACAFGKPGPGEAKSLTKRYSEFEAAGIRLRMLPSRFKINGRPGYLHAKAFVVDDELGWVGSVNGSITATSNNREFGVVFRQASWVKALTAVLDFDHRSTDTQSWKQSLNCVKDGSPADGLE